MEEYSRKKDRKAFTRDAIIGLGEDSFRKNYYPELQEKIMNLEQINARNCSDSRHAVHPAGWVIWRFSACGVGASR